MPFVKLGMHAGMGGTHLLPEVVGEAHARDLLLTGRVVDADEALRIGLVSRVLDPATFLDDVLEIAAGIAGSAPIATRLTKLALLDGGHARPRDRPAVGGDGPADHPGHRGPPGGDPGQQGEAAAASSGAADVDDRTSRGPRVRRRRPAFPLRISPDGPGGLVWAQR